MYDKIKNLSPDEKNKDQFILEYGSTTFLYQTTFRAQLLCQLFECISRIIIQPSPKFISYGPYVAQRLRKDGMRIDCKLTISSFAILELDLGERVLQEYKWTDISKVGIDELKCGLYFEASGRFKIFYCEDFNLILKYSKLQIKQLGLSDCDVQVSTNQDIMETINLRTSIYRLIPTAVSVFDVSKKTRRYFRQMPRQLHISEVYIVEKDSSGEPSQITKEYLDYCLIYLCFDRISKYFLSENRIHIRCGT